MKKLFIPAILSLGMVSSVLAMDQQVVAEQKAESPVSSDVFYTGKSEIKFSEQNSIEFSYLIGYKTRQDAKNKENGVLIGLDVKTLIKDASYCGSNMVTRFVDTAHDSASWWTKGEYFVARITASQLNSQDPFQGERKLSEVEGFIKRFDALSADLKVAYLKDLKTKANSLMDYSFGCDKLEWAIDVINYLINLKEYSKADKVALFTAYKFISADYFTLIDEARREAKNAAKYQLFKEILSPSVERNVCYAGYKSVFIQGGSMINFSNLIGYKTEDDAKHNKDGFVIGVFCECRNGMTGQFFGFVLPEFAEQEIWINACCTVQKIQKEANLKLVEELWTEFKAMEDAKKAEYLDNLVAKAASFEDKMYYLDAMAFEWTKNAVNTLKKPTGKVSDNVYKIILYCTKVQIDALAEAYKVQEV